MAEPFAAVFLLAIDKTEIACYTVNIQKGKRFLADAFLENSVKKYGMLGIR